MYDVEKCRLLGMLTKPIHCNSGSWNATEEDVVVNWKRKVETVHTGIPYKAFTEQDAEHWAVWGGDVGSKESFKDRHQHEIMTCGRLKWWCRWQNPKWARDGSSMGGNDETAVWDQQYKSKNDY